MIAIKKNRIENGDRGKEMKSNPHSNGINFSRQFFLFLEIKKQINIREKEIKRRKKIKYNKDIISYLPNQ
jgi:hypothetical protein